jgi:DNA-directed RNA polymerase specialized sigma24 family protein
MKDNIQKELFLDIIEKSIGIILKISRAYTRTVQDKENLINDITLELWKSFRRFKGDSKISTWIYRVTLNSSMNFKRKKEHDRLLFLDDIKQTDPVYFYLEHFS